MGLTNNNSCVIIKIQKEKGNKIMDNELKHLRKTLKNDEKFRVFYRTNGRVHFIILTGKEVKQMKCPIVSVTDLAGYCYYHEKSVDK